jgi:hypothetical protein
MAAPVVLVQPGILLGRLPSCQVVLNHPTVSRVHAGINRIGNDFYLINLSSANTLIINGRLLPAETADILAAGDVVEIGPFEINIENVKKNLALRISQQAAGDNPTGPLSGSVSRGLGRRGLTGALSLPESEGPRQTAAGINDVLKVFWQKRTRDRSDRLSPLHPRERPLPGKARINWRPTGDLARDWPGAIFIWSILAVAIFGVLAAFVYAQAFSPAPLSAPHTRATMDRPSALAIANRANAGSCTTCHRPTQKMESTCVECHQGAAFHADIIDEHRTAGVTCVTCHEEHQGESFQPREAAFATCAACHNDANRTLYNGKAVHTPHGGSVGYPVVNGEWIWKGLSQAELAVLPEVEAQRNAQDGLKDQRSKQFHALHVYRVRAVPGLPGNALGQVSCSTCHRSFDPVDRITPATTCASCHQKWDPAAGQPVAAAPINCTSCHVQHPLDAARWGDLLTDGARQTRAMAILAQIKAAASK